MHVINWDTDRGCSCKKHMDAIDWCGCSPMVIRQRDFEEMSAVNAFTTMVYNISAHVTVSLLQSLYRQYNCRMKNESKTMSLQKYLFS